MLYFARQMQKNLQGRGQDIKIPDTIAPDPVEVFDQTGVDKNVFRFVIYICWLQKQPDVFQKYLPIREKRFATGPIVFLKYGKFKKDRQSLVRTVS